MNTTSRCLAVVAFCVSAWIPAKSPAFDPDWAAHGHLDAVVETVRSWVARQELPGITLDVIHVEGRTPVLFFDIPPTGGRETRQSVLFYGHLDKQPEMTGWRSGLVDGTLRVGVLSEGVHSGDAGGVVPSTFGIARQLLNRIDAAQTGGCYPDDFREWDTGRSH